MNMKRLVFLFVLAAACFQSHALDFDYDDGSHGPYWGVRAGLDISIPGHWKVGDNSVDMFDNGAGFTAGAIYNIPLVKGLFLEPGVSLYYDTYHYDGIVIDAVGGEEVRPQVRKFGFRVPVNLGWRFDINENCAATLFTGPQLGIGVSASTHLDSDLEGLDELDGNLYGDKGAYRRIDLAWSVGGAFLFGHWQLTLSGDIGLLNLHKGDIKFHENRVALTLGYNF